MAITRRYIMRFFAPQSRPLSKRARRDWGLRVMIEFPEKTKILLQGMALGAGFFAARIASGATPPVSPRPVPGRDGGVV